MGVYFHWVTSEEAAADPAGFLTTFEENDLFETEATASPVTYSGQDFDINGLVRRLNNEDIVVPSFGHHDERIVSAGFQRGFVWRRPQMDRFIESILLGYPIPGIFLVRQSDRRYLVLDGQQRLKTLQFFHEGEFEGKEFVLEMLQSVSEVLHTRRSPTNIVVSLMTRFCRLPSLLLTVLKNPWRLFTEFLSALTREVPSLRPMRLEWPSSLGHLSTFSSRLIQMRTGDTSTGNDRLDCATKRSSFESSPFTRTPLPIGGR